MISIRPSLEFLNLSGSLMYEPHRFRLALADLNLKDSNKNMALLNLSIYYKCENIKSTCKNNKLKICFPTLSDEFDLPNGSYSVSEIQDYFK